MNKAATWQERLMHVPKAICLDLISKTLGSPAYQTGLRRLLYQLASWRDRPPGTRPPSLNQVSALYAFLQSLFFSCCLQQHTKCQMPLSSGIKRQGINLTWKFGLDQGVMVISINNVVM